MPAPHWTALLLCAAPAAASVRPAPSLPPAVQALPAGFGAPLSAELGYLAGLVPQADEGWPGFLAELKSRSLDAQAPYRAAAAATLLEGLARGDAELGTALARAGLRPAALIVLTDAHRIYRAVEARSPGLDRELAAARGEVLYLQAAPAAPAPAPSEALAELAAQARRAPPGGPYRTAAVPAPQPSGRSFEDWRRELERASADGAAARLLAQADRELSPERSLALVQAYVGRELLAPLPRPRRVRQGHARRRRRAASELASLFAEHGWGELPHHRLVLDLLTDAAEAAAERREERPVGRYVGRRRAWALAARLAPVEAAAAVLARRPELGRFPNTGWFLADALGDLSKDARDLLEAHESGRHGKNAQRAWERLKAALEAAAAAAESATQSSPRRVGPEQVRELRAGLRDARAAEEAWRRALEPRRVRVAAAASASGSAPSRIGWASDLLLLGSVASLFLAALLIGTGWHGAAGALFGVLGYAGLAAHLRLDRLREQPAADRRAESPEPPASESVRVAAPAPRLRVEDPEPEPEEDEAEEPERRRLRR